MLFTFCDVYLEWTILDFNRTFAFADKNVHHEVADAFRVDLKFDQAVVALGDQGLRRVAIRDQVEIGDFVEDISRVVFRFSLLSEGVHVKGGV